jgi:uncharacterized repeat protein (TIGR01451 family)
VIFQVQSISTTYTAPSGGTNDKFYADACGWDNNPLSPTYRSCIGPVQYSGGKAGGNVVTIYTVKVISTGTTTAGTAIVDFSGSSYHYNSDYGASIISITALPPPVTLTKIANQTTATAGSRVTYTLRVINSGSTNYTLTDFVDTPPTNPAAPTYFSGSSTFNGSSISNPVSSGSAWMWSGSFSVPAGATRNLTYQMVMPSTPGTYTNSAIAHVNEFQIDTTQSTTDNAPATASVTIVSPPTINLVKSVGPLGPQIPGTDLTYTIVYTNNGGKPASNFVVIDPNTTNADPLERVFHNVDFKIGSMTSAPGTSGLVATFAYSNDGGTTWTYTPVSGGGGAPAGYDRNVTNILWSFTSNLSHISPNNTGSVSFVVRIR